MNLPKVTVPRGRGFYSGGRWRAPKAGREVDVFSPADGRKLCSILEAGPDDVDQAVADAVAGFETWRNTPPAQRALAVRRMAAILRDNAEDLALLDALDCGNPVAELVKDVEMAAELLEFFAGLHTEAKGVSVPHGPDLVSYSTREPYGVIARICPFNHPLMFAVCRAGAPLVTGNVLVVKPPEQAPLSALRVAELFDGVLPPGVFNVLPGDRTVGAALVSHPDVAMSAVTGSVPTGKAVMRAGADTLKRVLLELGGKNALIACPESDPDKVASAAIRGMNFTWCGQSCGSTSRAFIHEDIYDAVVERLPRHAAAFQPGLPHDPATTMGCVIDRTQFERVMGFIDSAKAEGARLVCGGNSPADPALAKGFFIEPTVFADVTPDMRIAREEIFGPVLSVIRWRDEAEMLRQVNAVEYGLTGAVWCRDVARAHRLAAKVQAGFIWINDVSRHAIGSSFGGYKQSGIGREESIAELLEYTQEKNVLINLNN